MRLLANLSRAVAVVCPWRRALSLAYAMVFAWWEHGANSGVKKASPIQLTRGVRVAGVILVAFVVACMIGLSSAAPGTAEAQESSFEYALVMNAADLSDAQLGRALDQAKGAGVTTVMTGAVWWYLNRNLSPREYD